MSEMLAFQALLIVCATTAFVASLQFVSRLITRKREQRLPPPDGTRERLERIELTVEATAVEVERIAEANRFMAKLLSDRVGPLGPASRPERVITPH